jgi:hypothetical protein
MQDTTKQYNIVLKDTLKPLPDSSLHHKLEPAGTITGYSKSDNSPDTIITPIDNITVCERNSIADITFNDSLNFISENQLITTDRFPFLFTTKNHKTKQDARASQLAYLKSGEELPARLFHNDWLIGIILFAAFSYSLIRTFYKRFLHDLTRFFFFRGINDPGSRDIGGLFNWQSTILNLITFLNLGLFGYYTAVLYNLIPSIREGFLTWLILVAIVIIVVTLRHIVCFITGILSDAEEVFREYLLGVYQSYRFSAIILFVIIILISYTHLFPVKIYFMTGFLVLIMMYLIRIIRLFIIFINRNISIFYLILYICALEILPVLILLKYSAGLV